MVIFWAPAAADSAFAEIRLKFPATNYCPEMALTLGFHNIR